MPPPKTTPIPDVLYPGQGLSSLELQILEEFFPQLTFRSFEEKLSSLEEVSS
jgi:hypothetical protein